MTSFSRRLRTVRYEDNGLSTNVIKDSFGGPNHSELEPDYRVLKEMENLRQHASSNA